jgi:regulator of ribonuclease activity A
MTASYATSDLCDVHKGDISGNFRVLSPVFRSFGAVQRFCRRVVTGKCCEGNWLV